MHLCNWSILQLHNLCVFSTLVCAVCAYMYETVCVLCVYVCVCVRVCTYMCMWVCMCVRVCTCVCVSTYGCGVLPVVWLTAVRLTKVTLHTPIHTYVYYTLKVYVLHNILCTHVRMYVIGMETSLHYTLEAMQVYLTCSINSNFHRINNLQADIWTC